MSSIDHASPASGTTASCVTLPERDVEAALLREQYRALAQLAPYFYAAAIAAAATAALAVRHLWPPAYTAAFLVVFLPHAILRVLHWLKIRESVDALSLDSIRRVVRRTATVGPVLAFTLSLIAVVLPTGGAIERSLLLFGVWIASAASAFCLTRLAQAAALIVLAASAPLVAALLQGGAATFWLAGMVLVTSCIVIVMLGENHRAFADIVRSSLLAAERRRAAEEAKEAATAIAHTDDLTSLPNRRWMQSQLASRVEAGRAGASTFAVGLLDLDGFKPINDIHGHPAGDSILRQVAARLSAVMRGRGHVARMGGDEFAVLCDGIGCELDALALAEDLKSAFNAPFDAGGTAVPLQCASGFALFPSSSDQADELIRLADVALYRAKASGRGAFCVFDENDERAACRRAALEQALHRAVLNGEIAVHFEPTVDLETGRVCGFESLARWSDPRLGSVEPSIFLPAAERIGVIDLLSRDLLRKATAAAARWPSDVALSFNLSAAQLAQPNAGSDIVATLEEFGLPPDRFEIEVTEAAVMKDLEAACATIGAVRQAGVRVALDDFGAGRSSLAQVRDLALDKIKIDKAFVDRVCLDPKIASLTRSIVDMARRLDLSCVAEGIDRPEQLEELRLAGCAGGQGALFGEAMPAAMAAKFIEARANPAIATH